MSETTLTVSTPTAPSTLVRLAIGGLFEKDDLEKLRAWSTDVKRVVVETYQKTKHPINIIIDITRLKGYRDPEALLVLADLMKKDRTFVARTATFGGSFTMELAQDVVKAFALRDNLKNFKTETEALEWLAS